MDWSGEEDVGEEHRLHINGFFQHLVPYISMSGKLSTDQWLGVFTGLETSIPSIQLTA